LSGSGVAVRWDYWEDTSDDEPSDRSDDEFDFSVAIDPGEEDAVLLRCGIEGRGGTQ
jgi:hypothetical protein